MPTHPTALLQTPFIEVEHLQLWKPHNQVQVHTRPADWPSARKEREAAVAADAAKAANAALVALPADEGTTGGTSGKQVCSSLHMFVASAMFM